MSPWRAALSLGTIRGMGANESQAAHAPLPGPALQFGVPNAASSAALDLSSFLGKFVVLISSTKTHLRAGPSTLLAASPTDVWLPADIPVQFKVTANKTFLRVYGAAAAGLISVAEAQDD